MELSKMYKSRFLGLPTLFLMLFTPSSAIAATTAQLCASKDIFHQQRYQLGCLKLSDEKSLNVISYINSTKALN